jgi:hypothetical protein
LTYSIELTITGLCLLVPDRNNPGRLVILLPHTPAGGAKPHEVILDPSDLTPPSPGFMSHQLEFPGVPRTGAPNPFVTGVVNLTQICAVHAEPADLSGPRPGRIRGRIELWAGSISVPDKLPWTICNHAGCLMGDKVVWTAGGLTSTSQLKARVTDANGNTVTEVQLPEAGGVAKVSVDHHAQGDIMMSKPPYCPYDAPHFGAYHAILRGAAGLRNPRLENCKAYEEDLEALGRHSHTHSHMLTLPSGRSPSIYTCMVAGAEPPP